MYSQMSVTESQSFGRSTVMRSMSLFYLVRSRAGSVLIPLRMSRGSPGRMWYAVGYGEWIIRDLPANELGQVQQHTRGRYHCTQRHHQRMFHNTDAVVIPGFEPVGDSPP